MNINLKQNFLIRTSTKQYMNFYHKEKENISCNFYDENGILIKTKHLISDNFIDYSLDIDKKDRIHLIYLNKDGELIYCIYANKKWSKKTLTKLDVKFNKYKYLTMKIRKNSINIFYSFNNVINPKIWTIQHITGVIGSKNNWKKKDIVKLTPGKYINPFYVDFDKIDNIHLVYTSQAKNTKHIYYTYYSSFLKRWVKSTQKISDLQSNNTNPYMFVDTKNTVHVIWCSLINTTYKLVYKQYPYLNSNNKKWNTIKIPSTNQSLTQPIIYEDRSHLRILFKQNNTMKCIASKNYGYSWNIYTIANDISDLNFIKYSSNYSKEKNTFKINHTYATLDKNIKLLGLIDTASSKDINNNDNSVEKKQVNINTTTLTKSKDLKNNIDAKNNTNDNIENLNKKDIDEIIKELNALKNLIKEQNNINNTLSELLSILNKQYNDNSDEIDKISCQIKRIESRSQNIDKTSVFKKLINLFK